MKHEYCPTCYQLIPKDKNDPLEQMVCSEYHTICKICRWPVAKSIIKDEVCPMCIKIQKRIMDKAQEDKKLKIV